MAKGIKTGGRQAGSPNKITAEVKAETAAFFKQVLSEEREAELWREFLLGMQTNIIKWQAFKRAVEYKRGMPKETVEHSGSVNLTSVIEQARKRAVD